MKLRMIMLCSLLSTTTGFGQAQPPEAKAPAVTGNAAAVRAHLAKVIPLNFNNVRFDQVLKTVKEKTMNKSASHPALEIYVDPRGLAAAGMTLETPISYQTEEGETLGEAMTYLLGAHKLRYEVKNGLFQINATANRMAIIDSRKQNRALLTKLRKPVELHFKKAPLEDVLKFIKSATSGPDDNGLPIYVDPVGLQEAGKTMTSPVTIDTKRNEPLKLSLDRLLKSVGLGFSVKDGLVTITSRDEIDDAVKTEKLR